MTIGAAEALSVEGLLDWATAALGFQRGWMTTSDVVELAVARVLEETAPSVCRSLHHFYSPSPFFLSKNDNVISSPSALPLGELDISSCLSSQRSHPSHEAIHDASGYNIVDKDYLCRG